MLIALAQLNFHIGNFEHNVEKIIKNIKQAKKENADLIVFSELSICGYPPADMLNYESFIETINKEVKRIAAECKGITAIIGAPTKNPNSKGKRLYNSALVLGDGEIKFTYNKGLLPDYDIFDEYRYFEPARKFETVNIKGKTIALTVCEDVWNMSDSVLYSESPMEIMSSYKPDFIINISASPFAFNHAIDRKKTMCANSASYGIPLINVNQVGANTDIIFDGGSLVVNSKGEVVSELSLFKEDFKIIDLNNIEKSQAIVFKEEQSVLEKTSLIHDALVVGIKDFFNKLGFKKAILGLSGGIDSAVTLALTEKAIGAENVWVILLPGPYSSEHSVKDAIDLANNINVKYDIIQIDETVNSLLETLEPYYKGTEFGIAEENLQARARAIILMGLSNKFGHILLNTSNKSEAAVGYGTLYGDMCGGLSVIGDVYKTEVFELAKFINKDKIVIPENTITKPPSAELRPDQKDSDSLPEYNILDEILYRYIECQNSTEEIIKDGFDKDIVKKTIRLVNINEHKRHQTAPVLRISNKSFGIGRRMPIVAKYTT
ncbi:MAG: NAD+ synthase [Bacteroidales bacterium]